MSEVIFTLYEKRYHCGVAALINSASLAGYRGRVVVGYRDALPPWAPAGRVVQVPPGLEITFIHTVPARHLGYHKPVFALDLLERFPEIETLHYFDPDIIIHAPWDFMRDWAQQGVGLVQDAVFREVSRRHPWRREWAGLLRGVGREPVELLDESYFNAGYFSIQRSQCDLLQAWKDVTLSYEKSGGDTSRFHMARRCSAVVSDQDLLAAALMGWTGDVSALGPEAMGFTGYHFVLSHAIESPKPWEGGFLRRALQGSPPTRSAKEYLRFCNRGIRAEGRLRSLLQGLDHRAAQAVSRFYRRPGQS